MSLFTAQLQPDSLEGYRNLSVQEVEDLRGSGCVSDDWSRVYVKVSDLMMMHPINHGVQGMPFITHTLHRRLHDYQPIALSVATFMDGL